MFMEATKARNEIKRKPKEMFRNVSLLMLCACQQAELVLTSTTPHCKSQQRTTGYTTHSASLFSHPHRQSPRECDADHQRMTAGTAADRYQRQPVTYLGSVTGAVPGKSTSYGAGGWSKPLTGQHLIPASPAAQLLPSPQGTLQQPDPKLDTGSQNQLSFC